MEKETRALIMAGCLGLLLLGGIIFLANDFSKIDKQGVACLNDPLRYAEKRMKEDKKEGYVCSCQTQLDSLASRQLTNSLNFSFKFS